LLIRKHLHVRGEDDELIAEQVRIEETPPRTWRRRLLAKVTAMGLRNTSTYVEKTSYWTAFSFYNKKHLHVRGEDHAHLIPLLSPTETPPRTWRRLLRCAADRLAHGNTSTYVEKTTRDQRGATTGKKHLHVRGEDPNILLKNGNHNL